MYKIALGASRAYHNCTSVFKLILFAVRYFLGFIPKLHFPDTVWHIINKILQKWGSNAFTSTYNRLLQQQVWFNNCKMWKLKLRFGMYIFLGFSNLYVSITAHLCCISYCFLMSFACSDLYWNPSKSLKLMLTCMSSSELTAIGFCSLSTE